MPQVPQPLNVGLSKETGDEKKRYIANNGITEDVVDAVVVSGMVNEKPANCLVDFQAHCRGFLVRQKLLQTIGDQQFKLGRGGFRGAMVPSKSTIPSNSVPIAKARKSLEEVFIKSKKSEKKATTLVSMDDQRKYGHLLKEIVLIQRFWRRYRHFQDFQALLSSPSVPLALVRKYIHVLEVRPEDLQAEEELKALRQEISRFTRATSNLRRDAESLELKMGLVEEGKLLIEDVHSFYDLARRRRKERVIEVNQGK